VSDGDTTHAFDADLEERLLRFFTETGLPVPILLDRSQRCKFVVTATRELHQDMLQLLAAGSDRAPSSS